MLQELVPSWLSEWREEQFHDRILHRSCPLHQLQEFFSSREVTFEGQTTASEVLTDRDPIQRNHNARVGLDYELTDKTVIGALVAAYDNKWTMDAENIGFTEVNDFRTSSLELFNVERNQWKHAMANVNVEHRINELQK